MKKLNYLIILLLCAVSALNAQDKVTLKGEIVDLIDGTPVVGASITEVGTTNGVLADFDGLFSLVVSGSDAKVEVSFIGMKSVIVSVSDIKDLNNYVVKLENDVMGLDDVIVIGYGTQKKSSVTGAISSIKSEDIDKLPIQRPEQALQGQVAGVSVASNSGQPGSSVAVKIRGVGTTGASQPLYIVDGSPAGDISYLASTDIASMEVLKDAAASSIYGSRGANGVILITTKKGRSGKLQVSYDGYYGLQSPSSKVDLLNAEEYVVIMNEAYYNGGSLEQYVDPSILDKMGKEGTDWQEEIFNNSAAIQSHTVTMSGGSDNMKQSLSLSYFSQDGVISEDKSNYERYNFRANNEGTAYDGRLKVGATILYSHMRSQGVDANGEYDSPTGHALNMDPITPVYNDDGTFGSPYNPGMQEIVNPIAKLFYLHDSYRTDKVVGNIYGEYEIIEGLKFKSSFGIDYAYQIHDVYTPIYYLSDIRYNSESDVSKEFQRWYNYNWENVLSYNKTIADDHTITAILGTTAITNYWENLSGSGSELIIDTPDNAYLANVGNIESKTAGGSYSENSLLSAFGRVNYSYLDKYLVSLTLRYDGSSRFGSNNQFASFPAISTGWVASEEEFLADKLGPLDFVKIRASWGQNGNENIGDFAYLSSIANNNNYNFDAGTPISGSAPSKVSNPDLKWETSEQLDFGFDLRFKNNIFVNFDYYDKKTKDLLIVAPIPAYVGNSAPSVNGGNVSNKGIELLVGYSNNDNEFTYGGSLNISTNKNEVTAINNDEKKIYGVSVGPSGMKQITMAEVGQPIAFFNGLETDGIFQNQAEIDAHSFDGELIQKQASPGDFRYVDQNNDGVIDSSDRIYLGDPHPDYTYGINLNMGYKGFDMSLFFYGVGGNQIIDATRRYDLSAANYSNEFLNRWTGEGSTNVMPRVTFNDANGNLSNFSDFMVKDADYFRLKNLQIGYSLPESVLEAANLSKVRFYISGENLFTITSYKGYDPEIGSADYIFNTGVDKGVYPKATMFTFGANINF